MDNVSGAQPSDNGLYVSGARRLNQPIREREAAVDHRNYALFDAVGTRNFQVFFDRKMFEAANITY
jgi:hypothetical protein